MTRLEIKKMWSLVYVI